MGNNLKVGDRVRNKRTGTTGEIVMIPHPDYRMNWVKVQIIKEPATKYKTCWAIRNIELDTDHDEKRNQDR